MDKLQKQRNFCVNLLCKTKKIYQTTETFGKTIKLFFSNKCLNSNKLMLKENNWLITEEKELASVMNNFFVNIKESLDLKKYDDPSLNFLDSQNLNDILEKHKHHSSVHKISQNFMANENSLFNS